MSEQDKEIAIHALNLLGALVEVHADNNIATPPMYEALELAVRMAEQLEDEELVENLKFTLIQTGEVVATLTERMENLNNLIEQAKESDTLGEFVKNLTKSDEPDTI
jgi:P2-related tail formation protein